MCPARPRPWSSCWRESGYLAIEPEANGGERSSPTDPGRRDIPIARRRSGSRRPARICCCPTRSRSSRSPRRPRDDYGLAALDLRYTKISGSGEQFEFQEGIVPLRDRARERSRRGRRRPARRSGAAGARRPATRWSIASSAATAGRATPALASSDTFFVEVAGPGQVALEGFELPPDRERYALSQQMIVLKLERLRARERTIDRATLEQEVGESGGGAARRPRQLHLPDGRARSRTKRKKRSTRTRSRKAGSRTPRGKRDRHSRFST